MRSIINSYMLEDFRDSLGWSQEDLAHRLLVSQRTVSNLERDIYNVSQSVFEQILLLFQPDLITKDGYRFMIAKIRKSILHISEELGVSTRTISRWMDWYCGSTPNLENFRRLVALYFKSQGWKKVPQAF